MDETNSEPEKTQRLKIRVGDMEFDAEGPVDLVKEQFKVFMEVVTSQAERKVVPAPTPPTNASILTGTGALTTSPSTNSGEGQVTLGTVPVTDELLSRVFRRDADGISLLALPRTDDNQADALVALLYGYRRLLSRASVNGYTLMRSAKQSGIGIPRVDKILAKRNDYVLAAGSKRGRVYSLNNPGVIFAEDLLRRILG